MQGEGVTFGSAATERAEVNEYFRPIGRKPDFVNLTIAALLARPVLEKVEKTWDFPLSARLKKSNATFNEKRLGT